MSKSIKFLKVLTVTTIFGTISAVPSFANSARVRKSSLPAHLLEKVVKPKERIREKRARVKNGLNPRELNSRFSSWAVNPANKTSSINLLKAWKNFAPKKEVVVAVVDTGIDPVHPFLKDNVYAASGDSSLLNYGKDYSKGTKNEDAPYDDHGHGTHVAGIIRSVFPKVKILPLKYYNNKASGRDNLKSTIKALKYAIDQNVDIINYSGGGPVRDSLEERILKEAQSKGIIIIAAAGNEESNIDKKANRYFPASYGLDNIISVTAHDQSLNILSSSNYGKQTVDIAAPGWRINSAAPQGRSTYLTGTSQATAFVTGVTAMIKAQYPNITAAQMKEVIRKSAKREITMDQKCISGGRLDAAKAQVTASQMFDSLDQERSVANTKKEGKIIYRKSSK